MRRTDSKHCQIVGQSLSGARGVDEQTFESLAVLAEKLDYLKSKSDAFAGVQFSEHAAALMKRPTPAGVGG